MENEEITSMVKDTLDASLEKTKEILDKDLITTKDILDESLKATNEIVGEYAKLNKQTMDNYLNLVEKHGDIIVEYCSYVASDVIDSYNKLMELRKECIDKYINFYTLMFKDEKEMDISKPMKSLLEKKHNDIDAWQKEIAPLHDVLEISKRDSTSDERANEILESLMEI